MDPYKLYTFSLAIAGKPDERKRCPLDGILVLLFVTKSKYPTLSHVHTQASHTWKLPSKTIRFSAISTIMNSKSPQLNP